MKLSKILGLGICCSVGALHAQELPEVPAIHKEIITQENGKYYINIEGKKIPEIIRESPLNLQNLQGNPSGTAEGLAFDFGEGCPSGTLYYGFIPYEDSKFSLPVYFKKTAKIDSSRAEINLRNMAGRYDMIGWEKSGKGVLGYRVTNSKGEILYDGKIGFKVVGNTFETDLTMTEGVFVNILTDEGATFSFTTNRAVKAEINVHGKSFFDPEPTDNHEIKVTGLKAGTTYEYEVKFGENSHKFAFRTAPKAGSRQKFTFAYCSDSRNGQGGGERNVHGANFYIMKKIMALALYKNSAFMQFSGDLINGYLDNPQQMELQYANWKRAVEPFHHYMPIYKSIGNHESLTRAFWDDEKKQYYSVDRFPYETESMEVIFANSFVNPTSDLESEDGASYDPNPNKRDFPSYKETVFDYTYDNVAVIVLNSNYLYAPNGRALDKTSGGLHAYIMDNQLKWLAKTIVKHEKDKHIDHIFVTQHTPFFPNGGHVSDDMWYGGNNDFRPHIAGKPLEKGIIERRDQLLDILVNKSQKVRAILTGDEHNYAKTEISPKTNIYPKNWEKNKLKFSRTIYQINNGAAGAPYYAQEQTPWTPFVSGFSTQNALVLFHIEGKNIEMEVLNPDTLEAVDSLKLR